MKDWWIENWWIICLGLFIAALISAAIYHDLMVARWKHEENLKLIEKGYLTLPK